jgi:hypothetical protein
MAKYWIMPHDMDKITAYNAHLASQLELYKNYDVFLLHNLSCIRTTMYLILR